MVREIVKLHCSRDGSHNVFGNVCVCHLLDKLAFLVHCFDAVSSFQVIIDLAMSNARSAVACDFSVRARGG